MHGKYPVWLDTARDGVKCNTMQSGNEYSAVLTIAHSELRAGINI